MSELNHITEFDVYFDEGAPRDRVTEMVLERTRDLLIENRVDPKANVILVTHHTEDDCPVKGKVKEGHHFALCTCDRVRILICTATDDFIREGEEYDVLSKQIGRVDPREAN